MTSPPATILIVDDEIQNRKLLETLLRPEGYLTVSTASGEEALASIARRAPDLILLDVLMPGMDGCQVASTLKSNPATSSIPIIMVTVQTDRSDRLAGLNAGAEEFLTKPIDRAELWLRVRNLLRLKTLGDVLKNQSAIVEQQVKEQVQAVGVSELNYRRLFESAQDGILILDFDTGRINDVNPFLVKLLGFSPEEMLGKTVGELSPFRDIESNQIMLERLQKDGYIRYEDLPLETRDGRRVAVEFVSNVYQVGDKKVIQCNIRDVTVRKRAEEALRESDERFSSAFKFAPIGVGLVSPGGQWLKVNRALCDLLGYTEAELLARTFQDITHPADLAADLENVRRLIAGEIHSYQMEKRYVHRHGHLVAALLNVSLVRDGQGEPRYFISQIQDITGRKLAEEKIERLNRVYAVLSGINTLIVRVHDRRELFNEACRIAVEQGHFAMAWIGDLDPETQDVTPVAWAGLSTEALIQARSSARDDTPGGKGAVGRAIRERRPVFKNDIAAQGFGGPRLREILKLGFRSQITLPLYEDQTVAGTLTMYAKETNFFDEEEIRLLTELAGDISFALKNISRQQKLDKLARIRAVSSEVNATIVRIRDREALLRETCRIAVEHGKFELVWIGWIDQEKQRIEPIAWAGFSSEIVHDLTWAQLGSPGATLAEVIRTRKVAVRNDIDPEAPAGILRQEAMKKGCRSTVCVPFTVDGSVVAAIILFATGREFFDSEELMLLNEVATNVSFALQSISRQVKLDKLARIRAVSSEINAASIRIRDRNELFQEACRIAVEHGKFMMAWIGMLDEASQEIKSVATAGREDGYLERIKLTVNPDSTGNLSLAVEVLAHSVPVISNDIATDGRMRPWRAAALERGYRSTAMLPLLLEQRAVGVFALYAPDPGFFDDEEMKLLIELAGDISFALEHLAGQQKIEKLARIREVSSEINAASIRIRDRKALLEETCRIMSEHGKFEMIWIGAIDHDGQKVQPIAWAGFTKESAHAVSWATISSVQGPLGEAIRTRKVAVRDDIGGMSAGNLQQEALKHGCHSTVCLPLVLDDHAVALVSLYASGRGFFDKDELALLAEVASDISFALLTIEKQKKLDYLSYYDPLTGLANRGLFLDRVAQHLRSAVSGGHKLAVFLIDLERFKSINDSLGRPAGDALLKQVAEWLTRNAGEASLLARVGADHFAAVLPEVRQDGDMAHLLDKWMDAFLDHSFRLNDAVFRIAIKVGAALYPDDGADAETLFRNAEAALKKAKSGGERYLFHTQKMTESVAGKLTLENQLRQALDNEEFVLHYQPKVNLASGRMTSAEALIRWCNPRTGLVPPGSFIPVLEEIGLITEVGRWAIKKALSDFLRWRAAGLPAVRIAVNVSPLQLRNRGFVYEIKKAIGIDAHAPAGLELEITESLIMEDVKHSISSLQEIRALGVTIAIDDFGTGFSSLSYLAKLPVHTLKIDRSFVIDMTTGPDGLALVSTIINLAHSLKLKVVAEGVETEEQARMLRSFSCDEMQGYLFSKPVPGDVFETKFLAPPPAEMTGRKGSSVAAGSVDPPRATDTIR